MRSDGNAAARVPRSYTREEWLAEGTRRFGADPKRWRFKCPGCGNVQTMRDFEALGVDLNRQDVYFNCIGRSMPADKVRRALGQNKRGAPKQPCDYSAGGLITFGCDVVMNGGKPHYVFPFAE